MERPCPLVDGAAMMILYCASMPSALPFLIVCRPSGLSDILEHRHPRRPEGVWKKVTMNSYVRSHLQQLESEAIFIMREVAAQFERPVLLFSGGKDSIVMVHLAYKAFYPGHIPFPLLHIDTGHNFPETLEFRDQLVQRVGARLMVRYVQDSIDQGRVVEETGPYASRNVLQTVTLLDALAELKFEAAL